MQINTTFYIKFAKLDCSLDRSTYMLYFQLALSIYVIYERIPYAFCSHLYAPTPTPNKDSLQGTRSTVM